MRDGSTSTSLMREALAWRRNVVAYRVLEREQAAGNVHRLRDFVVRGARAA